MHSLLFLIVVNCSYHPNEPAVTTCERCRRPICVLDKRIFRKTRHHGEHSYTESYEYCPVCYSDAKIGESTSGIVGGIIFLVILVFFFVPLFTGLEFFNPIILIFLLIPIVMIIMGPMRIAKAKSEQKAFLQSTQTQMQIRPQSSFVNNFKRTSSVDVVCFQCGSPISLDDAFCSSCGDPTTDERKFYK